MELQNQPENAEQVTVFLYRCLFVLIYLHAYRIPEAERRHLIRRTARTLGTDRSLERQIQETFSSGNAQEIRKLRESPECRDMIQYMPYRYRTIPSVLWLLRANRRHFFTDLSAACHAADKSISRRLQELCWGTAYRKTELLDNHAEDLL